MLKVAKGRLAAAKCSSRPHSSALLSHTDDLPPPQESRCPRRGRIEPLGPTRPHHRYFFILPSIATLPIPFVSASGLSSRSIAFRKGIGAPPPWLGPRRSRLVKGMRRKERTFFGRGPKEGLPLALAPNEPLPLVRYAVSMTLKVRRLHDMADGACHCVCNSSERLLPNRRHPIAALAALAFTVVETNSLSLCPYRRPCRPCLCHCRSSLVGLPSSRR